MLLQNALSGLSSYIRARRS